jgi:hypothetical protein
MQLAGSCKWHIPFHIQAAQLGIHCTVTLVIIGFEYNGQNLAVYSFEYFGMLSH